MDIIPKPITHFRRPDPFGLTLKNQHLWKDPIEFFEERNRCGVDGDYTAFRELATCPICLKIEEEFDELAKKAVKAQEELRARLNSPDPAIREAAHQQVIEAGVRFIMDEHLGGS